MFGMIPKKRGLFGSPAFPLQTPGIGDDVERRRNGTLDPQMSAVQPQMDPAQGHAPKGGFFKPGGAGRAIAGTVGDFLLQQAEMDPIYQPQMRQMQAMAERQRQASLERDADWQDWVKKQEYARANPQPANNDTVADYEFIRQRLGDEEAEKYLRNKANPPQYRVGPDGRFYPIDVATPPSRPVGNLRPLAEGGPASAPGGFPR